MSQYFYYSSDVLIQWIYAPQDEFLTKRMNIIRARQVFLDALNSDTANYKELKELVAFGKNIQNYNVEKVLVVDDTGVSEIDNYEELKEWWGDEK